VLVAAQFNELGNAQRAFGQRIGRMNAKMDEISVRHGSLILARFYPHSVVDNHG